MPANGITKHSLSQQKGFDLIQLLISLAIGLVITVSAISLYMSNMEMQSTSTKIARLNQDVRAMMDIMVRDIQRAGFATNDPGSYSDDLITNPFTVASGANTTDLTILNTGPTIGSCILYAYNKNYVSEATAGTAPTVDNADRLGFRFDSVNGELDMRTSGTTNENCTNTSWETITEPDVEITALTFTLVSEDFNGTSMGVDSNGDGCVDGDDDCDDICDAGEACATCTSGDSCIYKRRVSISISARLRDDTDITQQMTGVARIRNNKFVESHP